MFKKLVSNLPFNPALVSQIGFYSKRLRAEETTRRFGFGLITVAFVAQMFISISPPETTLATSNNDIINGGGNKAQMAQAVRNNRDRLHTDLQTIFGYYNINADDIANGAQTTIDTRKANNYYSIGRTHRDNNDIAVNMVGVQTPIYSRRLDVWAKKSWDAVKIPGRDLWILNDCGNVVSIGNYIPPQAPAPQLNISKQATPSGAVKPGDIITYNLVYSNAGGQAPFTAIFDTLPQYTTLVSTNTPLWKQMSDPTRLKFMPDNAFAVLLSTGSYAYPVTVTARVNDDAPNGAQLCNKSSIVTYQTDTNYKTWAESQACNTVVKLCPNGNPMPSSNTCETPTPPTPIQEASCKSLRTIDQVNATTFKFEVEATTTPNVTVSSYDFVFSDTNTKESSPSTSLRQTKQHDFKKPGTYTVKATVNTSVGPKTSQACQIDIVVTKTPEAIPPILSKTARNITQNVSDANNTTANAGDIIEYTLITKNVSLVTLDNIKLRDEELADVSEYATLDKSSLQDGQFNEISKLISYPIKVSLKPGESITKTFRVKVNTPISQAPASKSDPKSNDLTMYNEYGNSISIKLSASPGKAIEKTVTTTIPKTGSGTGIVSSTVVFMLAAYLYARSRTTRRELLIIHSELVGGEI